MSPLLDALPDVTMVKLLLQHGAVVDRPDTSGLTELHWAAMTVGSHVINALIEAGVDPDVRAKRDEPGFSDGHRFVGWTPLHCAAYGQNIEGMAALLAKGANINTVCEKGEAPLHVLGKFTTRPERGPRPTPCCGQVRTRPLPTMMAAVLSTLSTISTGIQKGPAAT